MKIYRAILSFLKEVHLEMKKVNWLTHQEVFKQTIVVVTFALAVAVYLGTLDFVLQWILAKI